MADFLASFNLAPESSGPSNAGPCASVDDLCLHLRRLLDGKVTPTRAEHVSAVMELRGSAQFILNLADGDGDAPLMRVVDANEMLMHQPQDDPMLQKSAAKQIIAAIGATDGSAWTVREVSRSGQGWTFTYICKDSSLQWSRQNSKKPSKGVIGESSATEPDPNLISRPAFDCRGSVIISFSRSSRSLTVKYDHTPLHRTVAQQREYFKPPPRPVADVPAQPKTPKKTGTPRKKRDSTKAPGESAKPRKRKKKNDGEAQPSGADASDQVPDDAQGFGGDESVVNNGQGTSLATGSFPLNVPSAEVTRRREVASKMLDEAGVDPSTLSPDQFNIFSNQSPDLQKESLAMLAKYGAERLQIVHPSNREGSASAATSTSNTPVQTAQPTPSGPMTTKELAPEPKARRKRKSAAQGGDEEMSVVENGQVSPAVRPRSGKSRLACYECKGRRVKCPRETPNCTECQEAGLECEYPPPRSRKKKMGDDEPQPDGDEQDENDHDETEDHSSYSQMPVANMLTSNEQPGLQAPQSTFFQSASGLALPQPDLPHMSQQALSTASGLVLPHGVAYDGSNMGSGSTTPMPPGQANTGTETSSPERNKQNARGARGAKGAKRSSLPSESGSQPPQQSYVPNPLAPANWSNAIDPAMTTLDRSSISPAMPPQAARNARSRQADQRKSINSPQPRERPQQPNPLSQASNLPLQHSPRAAAALQAQARASPLQPADVARANSRQGHRSQTRTPVGGQTVGRGYHVPAEQRDRVVSHGKSGSLGGISSGSNYGEYSNTASRSSHQAGRIPYVPYSQQTSAPSGQSHPAFDRNSEAATTLSTAAPSTSAMAGAFSPGRANSNRWPTSQGPSTRSYDDNTGYNMMGSYGEPSSSNQWTPSQQNFSLRGQNRKSGGPGDQQTNYSWYHEQSQPQGQSGGQQDGFYNFNNQSGSYASANPWM